uniref:Cartilage oligomeric matrix protein n=1 Tax=Triatoma infestans TaxID=30076 RepID=A0A171ATK0_TRIIF
MRSKSAMYKFDTRLSMWTMPDWLSGSGGHDGIGLELLNSGKRHRQMCYDIDECADGQNGGCTLNSICINTEGSFTCGPCHDGLSAINLWL